MLIHSQDFAHHTVKMPIYVLRGHNFLELWQGTLLNAFLGGAGSTNIADTVNHPFPKSHDRSWPVVILLYKPMGTVSLTWALAGEYAMRTFFHHPVISLWYLNAFVAKLAEELPRLEAISQQADPYAAHIRYIQEGEDAIIASSPRTP
jgi:hypothetical protein